MRGRSPLLVSRISRIPRASVAIVGASLALASLASCAPAPSQLPAASLPSDPVVPLTSDQAGLREALAGHVALVSLWASWCVSCAKEIEPLNRLANATAGRPDALVVGIAVGDSPATVR